MVCGEYLISEKKGKKNKKKDFYVFHIHTSYLVFRDNFNKNILKDIPRIVFRKSEHFVRNLKKNHKNLENMNKKLVLFHEQSRLTYFALKI